MKKNIVCVMVALTLYTHLSDAHKCCVSSAIKETWPHEWLISKKSVRHYIQAHPPNWCQAIIDDGQLLGFFLVSWTDNNVTMSVPNTGVMTNATLWLKCLFVFPEVRRQRLGGTLIDAACEVARVHNAKRLDLFVLEKDQQLIDYYKKKDFIYLGTNAIAEHHMSCFIQRCPGGS